MSENPILDEMLYDASSGALLYKGVRYLLIRPETLTGFQKAIAESYGHQAEDKLFEGGLNGGRLSARKYKEVFNFSDREMVEFMMAMGNQIGWGNFSLKQYDPRAKRLCVFRNPFTLCTGLWKIHPWCLRSHPRSAGRDGDSPV